MATKKLLWFFLSRMALLGLALGAGLGLVYGATLLLGSLFVACVVDFANCFSGAADPVGGALYSSMFGASFGLLLGALAGLTLGLVEGLLLGVLTRLFYRRPIDAASYRKAAGTISGATGFLLLFAAWTRSGFDPTTFIVPVFSPSFFSQAWLDLVFITCAPSFAATAAMWWEGR
jgi:hypothetical protein